MKRYFIVGSIPQIYRRYPIEENGRTYYFANTLRYDNYRDLDKRYEKIVKDTLNNFYSWESSNSKHTGNNYDWKVLNTKLVFKKNLPYIKVEVESLNINENNEKDFNYIYKGLTYMFKENIWSTGFEEEFELRGDYELESINNIPLNSRKITEKEFNKD